MYNQEKLFNVFYECLFPENCEEFGVLTCYYCLNPEAENVDEIEYLKEMTEEQADELIIDMTEIYGDRFIYYKKEINNG